MNKLNFLHLLLKNLIIYLVQKIQKYTCLDVSNYTGRGTLTQIRHSRLQKKSSVLDIGTAHTAYTYPLENSQDCRMYESAAHPELAIYILQKRS